MRKNPLSRADVAAEDVPVPLCSAGTVLIANRYSLISAGTETSSVKRNVKDMVVKAMTDAELRQSVIDMLTKDGVLRTAERVRYETSKWTSLGYSGAGIALEAGGDVDGIRPGDVVAYAGEGHAETIRAAKNLCVPVPDGVSARQASFVALGSIALQAVRRAEVQVGDRVAVIGLGLVGQLVAQILRAAGARVIGVDVVPQRVELARSLGMEAGLIAGGDVPRDVMRWTEGNGVDRVLLCASTSSNEVVEQAVAMSRDRGRVVVVGFVGLDVPPLPFYEKELDLVVSRSYGPGRYDPQYETHGVDYPLGYVRWTERRNMEAFLRLLEARQVDVESLVTHEYPLSQAAEAYARLIEDPSGCLALLLRYDGALEQSSPRLTLARGAIVPRPGPVDAPRVAVVGCGAFARQFHLPNLRRRPDVKLQAIVTSSGASSREMAERYGARYCSTSFEEVLADDEIDAVMILTRDNTHAPLTLRALEAGKHVFCEKPLAVNEEECRALADRLAVQGPLCTVGFNRRFAPLARRLKQQLSSRPGPAQFLYRINAGALPRDHWTFDPQFASGRILGEVCHFVDLCYWLLDEEPVEVDASALGRQAATCELQDVSARLRFADGSLATIVYSALGSTAPGKERLEAFRGGGTFMLDDFRHLTWHGAGRGDVRNRRGDKGHDAELDAWLGALRGERQLEVDHRDGIRATLCCLAIVESARQREPIPLGWHVDTQEMNSP